MFLLRNYFVGKQLVAALPFRGGRERGGFRLLELALRFRHRRLERTRINLKKNVAFLNERAFLVGTLDQVTGNMRPDLGVLGAIDRSNPFPENGDIARGCFGNQDVGWRDGDGFFLPATAERETGADNDEKR